MYGVPLQLQNLINCNVLKCLNLLSRPSCIACVERMTLHLVQKRTSLPIREKHCGGLDTLSQKPNVLSNQKRDAVFSGLADLSQGIEPC